MHSGQVVHPKTNAMSWPMGRFDSIERYKCVINDAVWIHTVGCLKIASMGSFF